MKYTIKKTAEYKLVDMGDVAYMIITPIIEVKLTAQQIIDEVSEC